MSTDHDNPFEFLNDAHEDGPDSQTKSQKSKNGATGSGPKGAAPNAFGGAVGIFASSLAEAVFSGDGGKSSRESRGCELTAAVPPKQAAAPAPTAAKGAAVGPVPKAVGTGKAPPPPVPNESAIKRQIAPGPVGSRGRQFTSFVKRG